MYLQNINATLTEADINNIKIRSQLQQQIH